MKKISKTQFNKIKKRIIKPFVYILGVLPLISLLLAIGNKTGSSFILFCSAVIQFAIYYYFIYKTYKRNAIGALQYARIGGLLRYKDNPKYFIVEVIRIIISYLFISVGTVVFAYMKANNI
jgi:hypothetical protein